MESLPVKGGIHAFEDDALHLLVAFQHAALGGRKLNMGDVGVLLQLFQQIGIFRDGANVVAGVVLVIFIVIGDADMGTHINHLLLNHLAVACGDGDG